MKREAHRWRLVLIALNAFLVFAATANHGAAQEKQQPSGGRLPEETPVSKKVAPGPSRAIHRSPKASTKSSNAVAKPPGPMDSIEGKWWTSGNDFGTSQIFFTQNGTSISGSIMYADGRTGNLNGVMAGKRLNYNWTNSSGDQGTGWFEQSWNNFLGGTYRNQKGISGSWTLMRIAGNWCFGGSRYLIRHVTHNERGQVFFLTEDSGQEVGHLEGPLLFLNGQFGPIKGTMNYKTNRVDFASGAYWTWCGR